MRVPVARRDQHHRRPGPRQGRLRAPAGFVNAVLRRVAEHDLADVGTPGRPRPGGRPDRLRRRSPISHPRWVVDELRRRAGRPPSELDDAARRRQRAARGSPWWPAPGARPATSCRGEPTAVRRRTAWCCDGGDPGGGPGGRRGPRRRPGRGLPAGRARAGRGAASRAATSAGSTCAPAPAARRPCSPRWPAGAGARLRRHRAAAAPRRAWSGAAAGAVPTGVAGGRRRRRHPAAVAPGTFDRVLVDAPVHRARRAAPPARGALAPHARRPARGLVPLQRAAARARRSTPSAPAGWSLYATCSPVLAETRGVVEARARGAATTCALEDAPALLPEVPDCAGPLPGTVQLWPHRHGTDAMFLALLRRRLTAVDWAMAAAKSALRRDRGRRPGRAGQQPRPGLLPRERGDQARPGRVLPRRRRRASSTRCFERPVHAAPLPQGAGRRQGAPEAAAGRGARRGWRRCGCTSRAGTAPPTSCA